MEEKMIATDYTIEAFGDNAKLFAIIEGEKLFVGIIKNFTKMRSNEVHEYIMSMLASEDIVIEEPKVEEPKPKRKYTKHVTLAPAIDFGKVELKLVKAARKESIYYILKYKPNGELVVKIDKKGIYTGKCKEEYALKFSENDVKIIKNIADFDLIKKIAKNAVKDKIVSAMA